MDKRIEEYLLGILRPQLEQHSVPKDGIETIFTDIESRLRALLARWHDEEWRDTVLMIGREEGTFYKPGDTPLSIRSLVVVAIRNSALEDWHVERQYGGRGRYLDEAGMQEITEAAIHYFDSCALHTLPAATPVEKNPFVSLEQEFPYAWNAFAVLADIHREEDEQPEKTKEGLCFSFEPPETVSRPSIPPVAKQMQADKKHKRDKRASIPTITLSGMSPEFDEGLVSYLALIRDGRMQLFYTDSWKGISRHPQKLFTVINCILAYNGFIISPNYALASTTVSIRAPLLAPAHLSTEGKGTQDGLKKSSLALSSWHRSLLEQVVKGLPANEKQDERHSKRESQGQKNVLQEKTHLVKAQGLGMVGDYPLLITPKDETTMLILGTEQKRKEQHYQSQWSAPELPEKPVVFLGLFSAEASFVIGIEREIYVPFFQAALQQACYAVGGIKGEKADQEFWDIFELIEKERAFITTVL